MPAVCELPGFCIPVLIELRSQMLQWDSWTISYVYFMSLYWFLGFFWSLKKIWMDVITGDEYTDVCWKKKYLELLRDGTLPLMVNIKWNERFRMNTNTIKKSSFIFCRYMNECERIEIDFVYNINLRWQCDVYKDIKEGIFCVLRSLLIERTVSFYGRFCAHKWWHSGYFIVRVDLSQYTHFSLLLIHAKLTVIHM